MKMIAVESHHIAAIGHDPDSRALHVQFKNGTTYVYRDVSPTEHAALMASDSKGTHLHQHIKSSKGCSRK